MEGRKRGDSVTSTQITLLVVGTPIILLAIFCILAWAGVISAPKEVTTWIDKDGMEVRGWIDEDGMAHTEVQ